MSKLKLSLLPLLFLLLCSCDCVDQCQGTPKRCNNYFGGFTCVAQDGCHWLMESMICYGTATPCDEFGKDQCSLQQGCAWKKDVCD